MAFKYRGILSKKRPFVLPPDALTDDAARAAWIKLYTAESMKVWRALYEAHGVEYGNESVLLWYLAEAHVPGVTVRAPPKRVWDEITKAKLHIAIDEFVADRKRHRKSGASIAYACQHFAAREPWVKLLRSGKDRVTALRGHYDTADKRWVEALPYMRVYRPDDAKTLGEIFNNFTRSYSRETSRN